MYQILVNQVAKHQVSRSLRFKSENFTCKEAVITVVVSVVIINVEQFAGCWQRTELKAILQKMFTHSAVAEFTREFLLYFGGVFHFLDGRNWVRQLGESCRPDFYMIKLLREIRDDVFEIRFEIHFFLVNASGGSRKIYSHQLSQLCSFHGTYTYTYIYIVFYENK